MRADGFKTAVRNKAAVGKVEKAGSVDAFGDEKHGCRIVEAADVVEPSVVNAYRISEGFPFDAKGGAETVQWHLSVWTSVPVLERGPRMRLA